MTHSRDSLSHKVQRVSAVSLFSNKFNRKFGAKCRRYERWHRILMKLSEFEGLVNNYESASPEEVRALKEIHAKLYECQVAAKRYEEELRPYEQVLR